MMPPEETYNFCKMPEIMCGREIRKIIAYTPRIKLQELLDLAWFLDEMKCMIFLSLKTTTTSEGSVSSAKSTRVIRVELKFMKFN